MSRDFIEVGGGEEDSTASRGQGRPMTDRELLYLLYGVLRAMRSVNPDVIRMVENQLFPAVEAK